MEEKTMDDLQILRMLENKVRWLATWMVHHANHLRDAPADVKVGGHQASSASLSTIMTVLYFQSLERSDRVAVKPHASPNMHAIQYLLGRQTLDKLKNFRGFGGAQSYPSRTKDTCQIDFNRLGRPWCGTDHLCLYRTGLHCPSGRWSPRNGRAHDCPGWRC
jgi:pyruvate dehydrogenase E1 component